MENYFQETLMILLFLVVSLNTKLVLGKLKILSCHVKVTLNSIINSAEATIITGLDITPSPRSQKTNLQKTTGNISSHNRTIDDTYTISKAVKIQVQVQQIRWLNYIQQGFSWVTLMAMPANLTLFSLASTFDTLLSPLNLKE